MKKFRPSLTEVESAELKRLSTLEFSTYTEADIREEFLVELLKLLGYRKNLDYSVSREESFKLNPLFLSVGSNRIKLDYLCSLRKQYFWIIDAKEGKCKDPSNPPLIQSQDVGQAHFYCLHPEINCRYFIVSNGWYTNLYDRDNLDEFLKPLLSVRYTDMPNKFLELDRYIGSTQILPAIKEKLLDQIEKVFSAEIRVERLDEFIDAVKQKSAKMHGNVEKAAREQYRKSPSPIEGFKLIENEDISSSVYSIFQSMRAKWEFEAVNKRLIERIMENKQNFTFKEYFFFSKLMLERPYPVGNWFYPSVLYFLIQAHKNDVQIYYGQKTIKDLLLEWIDFCLFHFSAKKIQRYLWACERIHVKIVKQFIIMLPTYRDKIKETLEKHLFYLPEEQVASFGPNEVNVVIDIVERSLAQYRATFIDLYYDEKRYEFRETQAQQHYLSMMVMSKTLDETFGISYQKMKNELGTGWQDIMGYEFIYSDRVGGAICDILLWNEDILYLLGESQRTRIKHMAELGCTHYADKLCDKLDIPFFKPIIAESERMKAVETFFDPAVDQRV